MRRVRAILVTVLMVASVNPDLWARARGTHQPLVIWAGGPMRRMLRSTCCTSARVVHGLTASTRGWRIRSSSSRGTGHDPRTGPLRFGGLDHPGDPPVTITEVAVGGFSYVDTDPGVPKPLKQQHRDELTAAGRHVGDSPVRARECDRSTVGTRC